MNSLLQACSVSRFSSAILSGFWLRLLEDCPACSTEIRYGRPHPSLLGAGSQQPTRRAGSNQA